jgi:hypothetical protein
MVDEDSDPRVTTSSMPSWCPDAAPSTSEPTLLLAARRADRPYLRVPWVEETIGRPPACKASEAERHYLHPHERCADQHNPLAEVLFRYRDFFELFEDFKGYTDFFLLQDLVSDDASAVEFLLPFADFTTPPLPRTPEEYKDYRQKGIRLVQSRNRRMAEYVDSLG